MESKNDTNGTPTNDEIQTHMRTVQDLSWELKSLGRLLDNPIQNTIVSEDLVGLGIRLSQISKALNSTSELLDRMC